MFKELKDYNIVTTSDFEYSKANMSIEEARVKCPEHIVVVPKGTIVWSQNHPFTIEEIEEAKTEGIHYQFGFGPAFTKIPFDKIKFFKANFSQV